MRRHSSRDDSRRSEEQNRRLGDLISHAAKSTPIWSERVAATNATDVAKAVGIAESLQHLGTMSKADARDGFPDRVTSSGDKSSWRYGSSAGTVDRVTVISDFQKRDYIRATNFRVIEELLGDPFKARIAEIPPDACNVVCALRDEGPLELTPFLVWALRKGILFKRETRPDLRGRIERSFFLRQTTLEPLDPQSWESLVPHLDRHLERIVECRPNILRGLPMFLLWLGERAQETDTKIPSLKAILPYGGLMSGKMAERVSRCFGTPFFDFYGTSELGGVALQHENETGLRVFDDLMLVEVLDENNSPLPPGQIGKIVVTDYHNFAMPLIRYEVGDFGRWLSDEMTTDDQFALCRNARLEVMGRRVETTRLESGRLVTAREVMDVLFADPAILNASLEERRKIAGRTASFTLKVMNRDAVADSTIDKLRSLLEMSEPPRFREASYLRPEKSGKYQVFKAAAAETKRSHVEAGQ